MGALRGLARVPAASGSILTGALLSAVYVYGRLQPNGGYLGPETETSLNHPEPRNTSFRSRLASSALARRPMEFHMRDGSRVSSRIADAGGLLSVHVDRDYDIPGFDWANDNTIVDIGAHVGSFTVWAALRSPNAELLAVEPNPQEFVEHSLGTRIARDGAGDLTTEIVTVADLLAQPGFETTDLLKIDCEGMEYALFEAIQPELLRRIKAVACEYHPQPNRSVRELVSALDSAGFKVKHPVSALGVLWATR